MCLTRTLTGERIEKVLDIESNTLNVHATFLESWNVHVSSREAFANVQLLVQNTVCKIVVTIPDQRVVMKLRQISV
jgi:hypothetical protein